MELAQIEIAKRRRTVSIAVQTGILPEELAEAKDWPIEDILADIAWLEARRKDRLAESKSLSDEVAEEVIRLEDDEALIRRWIGQSGSNMDRQIRLMDRLQKVRELRLKLLGAFDRNTKSVPRGIVLVDWDGKTHEIEEAEIIELPTTALPRNTGRTEEATGDVSG